MWSPESGCLSCHDNNLDLSKLNVSKITMSIDSINNVNIFYEQCNYFQIENYPVVLITIFIDKETPFFEEFLEKIENIDYPKNKIYLSFSIFVRH